MSRLTCNAILVLFMQISLRRSPGETSVVCRLIFGPQEFIRNLKHFVLHHFCNFNSPKNLHLSVGQVKHRIHLPDRKIH